MHVAVHTPQEKEKHFARYRQIDFDLTVRQAASYPRNAHAYVRDTNRSSR